MKNFFKLVGIIAIVTVIGFLMAACDGGDNPVPPEGKSDKDRWSHWTHQSSTATINLSVDDDGVCTITVGGTAVPALNSEGGTSGECRYWNSVWYANASYQYTAKAGKTYSYKFEAWTDGAERALVIQWYNDSENEKYFGTEYDGDDSLNNCPPEFKITSVKKIYTINGDEPMLKSGIQNLEFQCANQTGTFYVKIISITEN